jgi:hypothetical protein
MGNNYLWNSYGVSMEYLWSVVGMESAWGRLTVGMESAYSRHVLLVFLAKRLYIYLETNTFKPWEDSLTKIIKKTQEFTKILMNLG